MAGIKKATDIKATVAEPKKKECEECEKCIDCY